MENFIGYFLERRTLHYLKISCFPVKQTSLTPHLILRLVSVKRYNFQTLLQCFVTLHPTNQQFCKNFKKNNRSELYATSKLVKLEIIECSFNQLIFPSPAGWSVLILTTNSQCKDRLNIKITEQM